MVLDSLVHNCVLNLGVFITVVDLCVLSFGFYGVVLGIDWFDVH